MRHLRVLAALFAAAALLLSACAAQPKSSAEKSGGATAKPASTTAAFPVTVTDDLDRKVTIDKKPERFVSLAPGNTEILYALGLLPKTVGVTTYDDYPAEVKSIKRMGDFTTPNLEEIASAKPDVVFVTGGIQMDVIGKLEGLGAKVIAVDPPSIERLYASIEMMGKATGEPEKAGEVVGGMKSAVAGFVARLANEETATCFVEVAQNPLYTAGTDTLLNDLITIAKGRNVVTEAGYVGYSLEQLMKDDPEVYLATKGSMNDPAAINKRPGYGKLSAVKGKRVYLLDDNLVSRPGPRIVDGLVQIMHALHPSTATGSSPAY